ncbi:MAG TPA: cbb3-type cytochrome oxidase assembly protein [Chloroflexia bacterium]|nr:cbb3-type cytochrome oxidase assembly protein [Chloroflexia bacterium]
MRYRVTHLALAAGLFLVLGSIASPAFAHDNLGGDELAMAMIIFTIGMTLVAGAALGVLWAFRSGQFNDVESAKYTMLENADDLDDLPIVGSVAAPARLHGGRHAP